MIEASGKLLCIIYFDFNLLMQLEENLSFLFKTVTKSKLSLTNLLGISIHFVLHPIPDFPIRFAIGSLIKAYDSNNSVYYNK